MAADRDILDYVRDQRDLGVNDSSIKKSLLDAGYSSEEASDALRKAGSGRQASASSMSEGFSGFNLTTGFLLKMNIVVAVLLVIMVLYFAKTQDDRMDSILSQQEEQFTALNNSLTARIASETSELGARVTGLAGEVSALRTSTEASDGSLKATIQGYQYDSLRRDSTLSTSLQDISNKSTSELGNLQKEFTEIKSATADFSAIIPKATSAVILIGEKNDAYGIFNAVGSGVFINARGYAVTNEHVVDEIKKMTIKTSSGTEYLATVVEADEDMDIALIKLDSAKSDFTYLEWGDSDNIFVGQQIIAIGSPVGYQSTVTQGIISNTQRRITGSDLYYIQTDVAINQGNSGGPIIDKDGKIVGIATRKMMEAGYEGLSFALRSNDVKDRVTKMLYDQGG